MNKLLDAVRAGGDIGVIRKGVEVMLQTLIEAEATEHIGAGRYERTDTRTTQRNGDRPLTRPFTNVASANRDHAEFPYRNPPALPPPQRPSRSDTAPDRSTTRPSRRPLLHHNAERHSCWRKELLRRVVPSPPR